jgi:hemoglobin
MRHMPFAIDAAARDRWLALMNEALEEAQIPQVPAAAMRAVFAHVADFMRNTPG